MTTKEKGSAAPTAKPVLCPLAKGGKKKLYSNDNHNTRSAVQSINFPKKSKIKVNKRRLSENKDCSPLLTLVDFFADAGGPHLSEGRWMTCGAGFYEAQCTLESKIKVKQNYAQSENWLPTQNGKKYTKPLVNSRGRSTLIIADDQKLKPAGNGQTVGNTTCHYYTAFRDINQAEYLLKAYYLAVPRVQSKARLTNIHTQEVSRTHG